MNNLRIPAATIVLLGATFFGGHSLRANGSETMSSGENHTLIIGENNTLWAWGGNGSGQIGNGTTADQLQPARIRVSEDEDEVWVVVSAGGSHSAAIQDDGTLWTWGANSRGQLGNASTATSLVPVQVGPTVEWAAVSAGGDFTLALSTSGNLYVWGSNDFGQMLDDPEEFAEFLVPTRVDGANYAAISAGRTHAMAMDGSGALFGWGNNGSHQLGLGVDSPSTQVFVAQRIGGASNWASITANDNVSMAIDGGGELYGWGANGFHQLGFGENVIGLIKVPTLIGSASNWASLAIGGTHTLARRTDGTLWGWGQNSSGQLGIPIFNELGQLIVVDGENNFQIFLPTQLGTRSDWARISAGEGFSAALDTSGIVFSTGTNGNGQLGDGTIISTGEFSGSFFGSPDLTVGGVNILTAVPVPGQPVALNVFVVNEGTRGIDGGLGIAVEVFLSLDTDLDETEDVPLVPAVAADLTINDPIGSSLGVTIATSIDLPDAIELGSYYVLARVDTTGVVAETDEENNEGSSSEQIDFFPDLSVAIANLILGDFPGGATVERGGTITFDLEITNVGIGQTPSGAAGEFIARIFISEDQIALNAGDIVLEEAFLVTGQFAAGETRTFTRTLDIPIFTPIDGTQADYFLGAVIDVNDDIVESDLENNLDNNVEFTDGPDVAVTGIDLGAALDNTVLEFTSAGGGNWFGQTVESVVGGDAAQSPPLEADPDAAIPVHSYIEANVPGPIAITYRWKIDSDRAENFLSFTVDGAEPEENGRISGSVDWTTVTHILPGEINQVRWNYVQGAEGDGSEAAWLDEVTTAALAGPDLLVENVQYIPGTYVLQLDPLSLIVLGKNQGETAVLPDNFKVEAFLSLDREFGNEDDVPIGELLKFQDLDPNDRFVYLATRSLPETMTPGAYYLIVVVDSTNVIVEFDETNNVFIAEQSDVIVEARPDLVVTNLDHSPDFYLITTPEGLPELFELDFTIENRGLANVPTDLNSGIPTPFNINIVLSSDRTFGDESDFVLLPITEVSGLPSATRSDLGDLIPTQRTYRVTIEIPGDIPIGEFFYLGAVVDPENGIRESQEENNTLGGDDLDLFFSEVELAVATETDEIGIPITNSVPTPFFGQSEITFDGVDAAQAGKMGNNKTAFFEMVVNNEATSVISFRWKVSSESFFLLSGVLKEDYLSFSIEGEEQARISGEEDWEEVTFVLPSGPQTLRWAYTKDINGAAGRDTGWVDNISSIVPDLTVTGIDFLAGTYSPGFDLPVLLTVENFGIADVPSTPPFDVQVYLSSDDEISSEDFLLDSFTRNEGIEPGGSLAIPRILTMPQSLNSGGDYFLIVEVDSVDAIPEVDENNNIGVSDPGDLSIVLSISLDEALDYDPPVPTEWMTGGNGVWFPQGDRTLGDGSFSSNDGVDAAQSPSIGFNEQSFLTLETSGPATIDFSWKVSSEPTLNFLSLQINGVEVKRISGEVDWRSEQIFIPSGFREVSWVWTRLSDKVTGEDAGWVDEIVLTPVTLPELVITNLEVTAGEYVLDVTEVGGGLLGTEFLEIFVEAENQGTDINPSAGFFSVVDMEVHLSRDNIFGNDDDLSLGEFARVEETLTGGHKIKFFGPIHLGDELPENDYYVIVKIDPLEDIAEFDETNNIAITQGRDITITRLPDLRLLAGTFDFDEQKVYYTEESLTLDYSIHNIGLNRVPGNVDWGVRISVRPLKKTVITAYIEAFQAEGTVPSVNDIDADSLAPIIIGTFSEQELMFGRSALKPGGDTIDTTGFLFLPHVDRIEESIEENTSVSDYLYWFEFSVDTNDEIAESSERNRFLIVTAGFLTPVGGETAFTVQDDFLFGIQSGLFVTDATSWAGLYDVAGAIAGNDTDSDGLNDLLEYAFNRNPNVDDASADFLMNYGLTTVDGTDYLSLTFDFVFRATDLEYEIQAAGGTTSTLGVIVWETILTLDPPYVAVVGADSLNGDGGLITDEHVIQALDNNYSSRITIRDDVPVSSGRMMRIQVNVP